MKLKKTLLQQGAEAVIFKQADKVIKKRIKKSYRLKELDDKIRKSRTRSEAKLLKKASKTIFVPQIIKVDEKAREIVMDFIGGEKLSDNLNSFALKKQKQICRQIGENVSNLHSKELIHGDLTTSNMILSKDNKIYFIDFGLGYHSTKIEDRAVDLHLLRQALEAKHFQNWLKLFHEVLKGYSSNSKNTEVIKRFKKVEARGRYKGGY